VPTNTGNDLPEFDDDLAKKKPVGADRLLVFTAIHAVQYCLTF